MAEKKKYVYWPAKAVITDFGDGRVQLVYYKGAEDMEETVRQARWVTDTVRQIINSYGSEPITLLSDTRRLPTVFVDPRVRDLYQEVIESGQILRLAALGNTETYVKLVVIKVLLLRYGERVRYFLEEDDAKRWLAWNL